MNQGSNFFGAIFSITDNVRAQMQFRREQQSYYFKTWFLIEARPILDIFCVLQQHIVPFLNLFCYILSAKTFN